jgi:omega-6 fatty acid desaturase (delta-12 desaturase)
MISNLSPLAYQAARVTLYATYTVWAGFFGTGLWVIGHECGHQAFSSSKFINNTVGWVVHSALLVPYHAWRISHGRHHAATGHLTRDEVFVPRTRKERGYPEVQEEGEVQGIK